MLVPQVVLPAITLASPATAQVLKTASVATTSSKDIFLVTNANARVHLLQLPILPNYAATFPARPARFPKCVIAAMPASFDKWTAITSAPALLVTIIALITSASLVFSSV